MTSRFVPVLGAALAAALASTTFAGSGGGWKAFRDPAVQDFGHQWSKVGDPHNAAHLHWQPGSLPEYVGRVGYKHRIMTHEVTVREWYGFLQAYAPYVAPGTAQSQGLIGTNGFIQFTGFSSGVAQYFMQPQFGDVPIQVSWRSAARYANFLHNDQADAAWAFETGAYDTSTFGVTQNSQGLNVYTDQQSRSEGARFWIPSFDEWTKAGHWDPNRFGDGQGGWWEYPTTGDTAPVTGRPELGGETNGGTMPAGQVRPLDAGSYPEEMSPWELLDVSGGAHEWSETFWDPENPNFRLFGGSSIYHPVLDPSIYDSLGYFNLTAPTGFAGIRLASVIPGPGSALVALMGVFLNFRRHRDETCLSHRGDGGGVRSGPGGLLPELPIRTRPLS